MKPKNSRQADYKKRKPWIRYVEYCRRRCNGRHTNPATNRGYEGVPCTITAAQAEILWHRDGAAQMIRPSLDRIRTELGYTFENCRFIEFNLNARMAWDKTAKVLLPDGENT